MSQESVLCLVNVNKLGLVLLPFEFNELPNLNFKAGI